MTIGKRLTIGFGVMLIMALGLGGSAIFWIGRLAQDIDEAVSRTGKKVLIISDLQANLFRMRSCQRGVMLFAIRNIPERARSNKEEFESRASAAEQRLRELKPLLVLPESLRLVGEMETNLSALGGYFETLAAASMSGKHDEAANEDTNHNRIALDSLDAGAARILELQKQLQEQGLARSADQESKARWISICLALVALLVAPFVMIAIQRVTRQLRHAAVELGDGSDQIASAAAQVAASSGSLAQGASEQAASLEETSASTEEITSMTRKNAENSRVAAEMMAAVDHHIQDGNRTLGEMVGSMQEINTSSDKISKIIKVIDEIAFQTNILALNAAVEGTRR